MTGQTVVKNDNIMRFGLPFNLLLIFIFFEYGRPQSFFPVLANIYPGWVLYLSLLLCLLIANRLFNAKAPQTKLYLILLLLMAFHGPIATNNFWAYKVWRTMALNFIFYMSVLTFVDSFKKIEKFINIWVVINLVCAFVGLKNGGRVPFSSFMGDENDFCLVMNMAIPFAYFMFLESDSLKGKVFYIGSVLVFVLANISSSSRGGFVGLVPVILYCWYKTPRKIMSTLIIVFVALIIFFAASSSYWGEIQTIGTEKLEGGTGTGAIRWYYWKLAWRMFSDYPLMGIGQGNFPWIIGRYEPAEGFLGRGHSSRQAHSLYFTLISELGLIGIVCFFGILYFSIRNLIQATHLGRNLLSSSYGIDFLKQLDKIKFIALGISGAMLGYLASGTFLSVLYYPHFWFLVGLSIAAVNIGKNLLKGTSVNT